MGQQEEEEGILMVPMQIQPGSSLWPPHAPSPLRVSMRDRDSIFSTAPVDDLQQQPDSPTSCTLPNGYSPVMIRTSSLDDYGLLPPSPPRLPTNQEEEAHYNNSQIASCYTSRRATDASSSFQSSQDVEPFNCDDDDLEYGDMYPPCYIADPCMVVRQAISFAETSLKCHNDDPSNQVKYQLIEATCSNYLVHGTGCYGHVNFTARAKGDEEGSSSQQELFFAELNLRGSDFTTLTCFRSLKEKDDQVGGRLGLQREEGDGIDDLDHCYACSDELKHPRDGASYHAGHSTGRRCYEFP
ncbi:hypothetical protein BDA96_10G246800 [Sorghum bicolor]|uniref:DUF3615 domain-containing protein n=2 Tax=Sorghum bicolor TaxID=4558 RepID=A0A921Q4Z5_SORBI|nr:uncharacterized protein LOC8082278 isoform X2 [Sorghum bicolor]KAG0515063.1 hypothetical protein BDA96_10G246800 [Sorghum bicolor]KXG20342.1 hypothetical protein SORBI_3010G188700 [Sorghum bicolor]|eukprot:XP_021306185.1 uncharacterized protein LOC8082278 isoform X2 [Sorghum bicolor]